MGAIIKIDTSGLSKPIVKLIEVIGQGCGIIYAPYLIKKTAEARAHEIKIISDAVKESGREISNLSYDGKKLFFDSKEFTDFPSLATRGVNREGYKNQMKQKNIEDINEKAAEIMVTEEEVSNDPLDEDWITRFFDYAEDVSDEDMQNLWSQILAGEVKKPGSFSMRALSILRSISKNEAELFRRASKYMIHAGKSKFLFTGKATDVLDGFDIFYKDILLLREIGILSSAENSGFIVSKRNKPIEKFFEFGDMAVVAYIKENFKFVVHVNFFTSAGEELLTLTENPNPELEYLEAFNNELKNEKCVMKFGKIIEMKGKKIIKDQEEFD